MDFVGLTLQQKCVRASSEWESIPNGLATAQGFDLGIQCKELGLESDFVHGANTGQRHTLKPAHLVNWDL